jgi:hypothetical protein
MKQFKFKSHNLTLKIFLILFIFSPVKISAQEYTVNLKPADAKFKEVTYNMWLPENVDTIKGIILHQHGCGNAYKSGKNAFYDLQWRSFAKKWNFALMGSSYIFDECCCEEWDSIENGSAESFIQGISQIAKRSGHQELMNAPWVLWGHSGGGHWAYNMVLKYPEKVICAVLKSPGKIEPSNLSIQVPMLCILGIEESYNKLSSVIWASAVEAMKYRIRKKSPVCIAIDPTTGHNCANSRSLAIPFIDECLKIRDLNSGTISRDSQCFYYFTEYRFADTLTNNVITYDVDWFPSKSFAEKWLEFFKTGNVTDTTPPAIPPYELEVEKADNNSVKLYWQADADIESGIKEFRIYRNNELINMDSNPWNFQIDYHDNPVEIYHKFWFVDKNMGKKGTITYQVSMVNKAGLESAKSKKISINL